MAVGVCFQSYKNSSCLEPVGPKMCAQENVCSHTDGSGAFGGVDESTLQKCYSGVAELQVFKNSSSCRPAKRVYGFNTTLNGCVNVGGHWGIMTCGMLLCLYDVVGCLTSMHCIGFPFVRYY